MQKTFRHCIKDIVIHIIIPIVIGGAVYILARSKTLLIFKCINFIGLTEYINILRTIASKTINFLPNYFVYSIPDALWVYSLTFFLGYVWMYAPIIQYSIVIAITGCIALGSEIGQAFAIVPGTFDWHDLVLCCGSFVVAILFIENKRKKICV